MSNSNTLKQFKNVATIVFFFCILLIIICTIVSNNVFPAEETGFEFEKTIFTEEYWFSEKTHTEKTTLPYLFSQSLESKFIEKDIPKGIPRNCMLYVETRDLNFDVCVDGKEIFNYTKIEYPFLINIGISDFLIKLPNDENANTITIYGYPQKDIGFGTIKTAIFGTKSAILLELLKREIVPTVFFILLVGVGVFFIICSLLLRYVKKIDFGLNLAWIGMFALLVSPMLINDVAFFRIFFSNRVPFNFVVTFSFILMPVPLLFFFRHVFPKHSKYIITMIYVFIIYFFVNVIMCVFDNIEPKLLYPIDHILIMSIIIRIIHISVNELKTSRDQNMSIVFGCSIMAICGLIDIFRYYFDYGSQSYQLQYFFVGVIVFIACLAQYLFSDIGRLIHEKSQIEVYKKMAEYDALTGLPNRYLLNSEFLVLNSRYGEIITVFVFDLNDLKATNDCRGHRLGDVLIKSFAHCLRLVFDEKVYRTGGDEFIAIIRNSDERKVSLSLKILEEKVSAVNEASDLELSYAVGYSSGEIGQIEMIKLLSSADEKMYKDKETKKSRRFSK